MNCMLSMKGICFSAIINDDSSERNAGGDIQQMLEIFTLEGKNVPSEWSFASDEKSAAITSDDCQ